VDVWTLHLPAYVLKLEWITHVPTLSALIFLFIFIGYLAIVWYYAYPCHRDIYGADITRREFVFSNIAFCIPLLIPWALLSGITDLVQLLPFAWLKQIINTTWGQIGFFIIFLAIAAIFAPVLVKRFWRCRPVPAGEDRKRIEALCRRAGVTYADIVYWPIFGGRMLTAGVMGLVGRFRYIMVTKALLRLLTPDEVDQVIAHEIGHVRRKHLLLYLLFFMGFMLVWYLTYMLSQNLTEVALPLILALNLLPSTAGKFIIAACLIASAVIYFRFVFGYFMRNFERQADLFVFRLFDSVRPLISTFGKIAATSGQPADKPNWHHFSIQQRVDYLRRSEQSHEWITGHDRKVRKSIAVYLAAMVLLGTGVYFYQRSYFKDSYKFIDFKYLELYLQHKSELQIKDAPNFLLLGEYYLLKQNYAKAVGNYEKAIQLDPQFSRRPEILSRLGNAYYEAKNFKSCARAWEQALALSPSDPELLNNLAWLLATASDEDVRDPRRALVLAAQAIDKFKAPHIWDTFAEALFVNGRYTEAVKAAEKALALAPKDMPHFKKQLAKFKQAEEEHKN
jgi:Zn-dependent protease with chaperone function